MIFQAKKIVVRDLCHRWNLKKAIVKLQGKNNRVNLKYSNNLVGLKSANEWVIDNKNTELKIAKTISDIIVEEEILLTRVDKKKHGHYL